MAWNHRILAHKDGDEIYFQIHEVYYNKKGKPHQYSTDSVGIGGDSIEGIKWQLKMIKKCLKKPILSVDDFPNEFNNT